MSTSVSAPRVGIFGSNGAAANERHGCGLWPAGYESVVAAAGGSPVLLGENAPSRSWDTVLEDLHGVVFSSTPFPTPRQILDGERLCRWCQKHQMPLLAIDTGLLILNGAFSGTSYTDLALDLPEALQHRHPPEKGVRHAMNVLSDTRLACFYGEGEVVVNSEHRQAVQRLARGFRICAQALDGVIEAIEADSETWFALGVQWHPASGTASGLDIQLFRGVIDACQQYMSESLETACYAA